MRFALSSLPVALGAAIAAVTRAECVERVDACAKPVGVRHSRHAAPNGGDGMGSGSGTRCECVPRCRPKARSPRSWRSALFELMSPVQWFGRDTATWWTSGFRPLSRMNADDQNGNSGVTVISQPFRSGAVAGVPQAQAGVVTKGVPT